MALRRDGERPRTMRRRGVRKAVMVIYRYSRWDGSQQIFELSENDLLEALSEDILAHGDLNRAMRSLLQRGVGAESRGRRIEGLRDLVERLRQQRRQLLERYNLESLVDDLKERLRDVIDTERAGIDRRLEEAGRDLAEAGEQGEHLRAAMQLLEQRAEQGKQTLDGLPESVGGAVRQLRDYDFIDPEARRKFQDLLDMLNQRMMENFFHDLRRQLQGMSGEDMERLKGMVRDLKRMLRERASGLTPDFDGFMERHGEMFEPDRPGSLDELIERLQHQMSAMQSLMSSMSPEMRAQLESLMTSAVDTELLRELGELASQVYEMFPTDNLSREYPFMGEEPVTLDQAMDLMGDLQDLDALERTIGQVMRTGGIEDLDLDMVEEQLGQEARRQLEQLQRIVQQLEEAGYLKRKGERLELTPRGIRKLAQRALRQVFSELKRDRLGRHEVYYRGDGGEPTGETKAFEFGDPFDIDLHRTLFNAVTREGPRVPVRLRAGDLEIHRTEHLTQAATVLLLDQSRSMGMFGSFTSAKKVALALYSLIPTHYPRDYFAVIGFSDYAMEIAGEDLADLTWNAWVSGTNMHHALMLSRRLLSKQKAATKQILMITDGEPTAHLEDGRSYFSYPPSYATIDATLKEVKRCTQAGVTINVFMLESSYYLVDFVDKLTRINRGRAFYTTPGTLGRYVMVDYLRARRQRVG